MVMFFYRNMSMSTFSGSSWDLWALTLSPAVENTRSLETEVAVTERYALARWESKGYLLILVFLPPFHRAATERWRPLFCRLQFPSQPDLICCSSEEKKFPSRSSSAVFLGAGSVTLGSALTAASPPGVGLCAPPAASSTFSSAVVFKQTETLVLN